MSGWIGVDLDGTLAEYHGWSEDGNIGSPIGPMVLRVRQWLSEGRDVRIFTARVYPNGRRRGFDREAVVKNIQDWCYARIGAVLPVTCEKDFAMTELWDDRCVRVEKNTGRVLSSQT